MKTLVHINPFVLFYILYPFCGISCWDRRERVHEIGFGAPTRTAEMLDWPLTLNKVNHSCYAVSEA
jgi:hypothetical protein